MFLIVFEYMVGITCKVLENAHMIYFQVETL